MKQISAWEIVETHKGLKEEFEMRRVSKICLLNFEFSYFVPKNQLFEWAQNMEANGYKGVLQELRDEIGDENE